MFAWRSCTNFMLIESLVGNFTPPRQTTSDLSHGPLPVVSSAGGQ